MPGMSTSLTPLFAKRSHATRADSVGTNPHISCLSANAASQNSVIYFFLRSNASTLNTPLPLHAMKSKTTA